MANFPKQRSLRIESLEDRRMLALPHALDGFSQGLLHTEEDFARIASKVAAQEAPWISGWNALVNEGYAQLGADPRPLETVVRGGAGDNVAQMYIDIQRAYLLAVRWKVTGDAVYADQSVAYLNAWKDTMTTLTGNSDRFLAAGIYGYQWANVAEIMRTYEGWSAADAEEFGDWLVEHFYQKNHDFLVNHNTAAITNYWANWDLCNIASMMAIGVYTDNHAIYNEAVDYLHHGGGNGALDKFVYYLHDGNLGQWQEAGRDQGHTVLGVSLVGPIMQMAWNQGLDLFAYDNNRFAAGAEYVAKYNQWEDVPYTTYNWGTGQGGAWQTQPGVSPAGRGAYAPGYELVYHHYANIKGVQLPWVEQVVDANSPEPWHRKGDQFGFGTLMYTLDPFDPAQSKPSGLAAVNFDGAVKLNWWGAVYAQSHNVYRAASADGVYELIASGVTDLMTYADHGMPAGQYFYRVTGVIDGVETDPSEVVRVSTEPELVVHLTFDEGAGATAADASGNGADATLQGGAAWTTGVDGGAVDLSGEGQHVELPENLTEDYSDYSIATWVYLDSNTTWSRVFDFGDSDGRYLFLTPQAGSGKVRFAIATVYGYNENVIEGDAPLPTGEWVHVAVTQSGTVGKLYVNGQVVGINDSMPQNALQLGGTSQNWIGRSQYPDPYLDGKVDDFRVYSAALGAADVYELATGEPAPAPPAAPSTLDATPRVGGSVELSWAGTGRGVDHYAVERSTDADGPYYTVAIVTGASGYTDSGLVAGQTYYYRVSSANEGGESGASPTAQATALPPTPSTPAGVTATALSGSEVRVSWAGAADAASYTVSRADASGGPYATLASGVTDTAYSDTTVTPGATYYYTVTAVNAAGESLTSEEAAATASDLVGWWRFDEAAGATAADSSGAGRDAAVLGGASWADGRVGGALVLDGADDHAQLPDGVVSGLTDFTITAWARVTGTADWTRIFDFGSGESVNMFLTPRNGSDGDLRFAIKSGGAEEQINTAATLSGRNWSHVAVTLRDGVGALYVNGVEVGRNDQMTLTPADLGVTTQNYLGKSQYPDPNLEGAVDDFRIYNRALSAGELLAMTDLAAVPGDFNRDGRVDAADYSLWRDGRGSAAPAFSGADGDGDGHIGAGDRAVWLANYGATAAPAVALAVTADEAPHDAAPTRDAQLAEDARRAWSPPVRTRPSLRSEPPIGRRMVAMVETDPRRLLLAPTHEAAAIDSALADDFAATERDDADLTDFPLGHAVGDEAMATL